MFRSFILGRGPELSSVFHTMENISPSFPQYGKLFGIFPHNGKNVSTLWKTLNPGTVSVSQIDTFQSPLSALDSPYPSGSKPEEEYGQALRDNRLILFHLHPQSPIRSPAEAQSRGFPIFAVVGSYYSPFTVVPVFFRVIRVFRSFTPAVLGSTSSAFLLHDTASSCNTAWPYCIQ